MSRRRILLSATPNRVPHRPAQPLPGGRNMSVFRNIIDFLTLGSDRPVRRLIAYYLILTVVLALLATFVPLVDGMLLGSGVGPVQSGALVLQDALNAPAAAATVFGPGSLGELVLTTTLVLLGTLALMLPVTWVYMSARSVPGHNQAIVQALIILPIVVAGIVLIVRNSLALAFSLAGVVAAVRFRNNLRDARDTVFIFLAIAVGFSAGVQTLAVGAVLSLVFNVVVLLSWRYDFGRNMLSPTASSQNWVEPLRSLARSNGNGGVPDRDIVLSLTPDKVEALAQRFDRVRTVVGPRKKRPRFDAVLSVTSDHPGEAQVVIQKILDKLVKRWTLDEVVTHVGKPSELYYLLRMRKSITREELITSVRARAGNRIGTIDLEIAEALMREQQESN
jgi:hypothetical protein